MIKKNTLGHFAMSTKLMLMARGRSVRGSDGKKGGKLLVGGCRLEEEIKLNDKCGVDPIFGVNSFKKPLNCLPPVGKTRLSFIPNA